MSFLSDKIFTDWSKLCMSGDKDLVYIVKCNHLNCLVTLEKYKEAILLSEELIRRLEIDVIPDNYRCLTHSIQATPSKWARISS